MTDGPFRTLCHRNGADLTFTEVARVANLAKSKKGELERIAIPDSTPTQIQLAGSKLGEYERFLADFRAPEGFRGFDLNLGCSSPEFMRQGIGAAMVRRVSRTGEVVRLIRGHGFECSVKMRLGLDDYDKRKGAYINLIENVDASFFVVHARTAKQTLEDRADFSVYSRCLETGKLIVANGDIKAKGQVDKLKAAGLSGAMIGRAAIGNPEIFRKLQAD